MPNRYETPIKFCIVCKKDVGLNRRTKRVKYCIECANFLKSRNYKQINKIGDE